MDEFFRFSSNINSAVYAFKILNYNDYSEPCSCGSRRRKKDFKEVDLMIEGKGKYPDFLFCGHFPLLIVSDRVLNLWKENQVTGFRSYPCRIFRKGMVEVPRKEAQYHHIEITGRCSFDLAKMGVRVVNKCRKCGHIKYNKHTWEFGNPVMIKYSWDGSDLFVASQFLCAPMCGQRILKIFYENSVSKVHIGKYSSFFATGDREIKLRDYVKENKLGWKVKK